MKTPAILVIVALVIAAVSAIRGVQRGLPVHVTGELSHDGESGPSSTSEFAGEGDGAPAVSIALADFVRDGSLQVNQALASLDPWGTPPTAIGTVFLMGNPGSRRHLRGGSADPVALLIAPIDTLQSRPAMSRRLSRLLGLAETPEDY